MTEQNPLQPEREPRYGYSSDAPHARGETPLLDESLLLAYVEDELTADEARVIEQEIAERPWLQSVLVSLRRDRLELVDAGQHEEPAPAHLVEQAMARVERSMLLDDDVPMAPVIQMPSRQPSFARRLAAAAGLAILLTVAGALIYNVLFSGDNFDEEAFDRFLAESKTSADTNDPANSAADDRVIASDSPSLEGETTLPSVETTSPGLVLATEAPANENASLSSLPLGQVIAADDDHVLFADSVSDPVSVDATDAVSSALDVGLALNMSWGDLQRGVEVLAAALNGSSHGALIANVSLDVTGDVESSLGHGQSDGANRSASVGGQNHHPSSSIVHDDRVWYSGSAAGQPGPTQSASHIVPGARADAKRLVSLEDQVSYRERGYQFVLVGTPSELNRVLRAMAAQSDCRVEWATESMARGRILENMSSPPAPKGKQWIDAVLWWDQPDIAKALHQARLASESARTEPVLRIPVRAVEENWLKKKKK